jgi:ABC-type antimicrobial peptide transport system permease subunit
MMVVRAARSIAFGGGVGLLIAYFIGRAVEALLFQVDGTDPLVFAGAVGILSLAALAAAYLPARRASTIDPMTALRSE